MTADDPAVVVRVPTEFEAHTIATILRSGGVESTVTTDSPSWTGQVPISPGTRGSAVIVRSADLQRAQAILRESEQDSVDLDWDEVDVGEREDDLPLRTVGRIPVPAKVAAALAAALLLLSALIGMILLFL